MRAQEADGRTRDGRKAGRDAASVLVVDDEAGIREFSRECLAGEGYDVVTAENAESALQALADRPFDVLLLDLRMPGRWDGMEVLRRVRSAHPETQVIVVTAHGSVPEAVEAMKSGAFDFMEKPIAGPEALRRAVRRALRWQAERPGPRAEAARRQESVLTVECAEAVGVVRRVHRELLRRRVYRAAATYAAGGFALLQVAELLTPVLPVPDATYRFLVACIIAGFPVAMLLGWFYDLGWRGFERTRELDRPRA